MVATFLLLGCFLVPAQPRPDTDWSLAPRPERGTELVYRGSFAEQAAGDRVRFQRQYRFETRVLVIESGPKGCDLAALTLVQDKSARTPAVRLERLTLSPGGRVSPAVPLPVEGPPSLEVGMFVELPTGRLRPNQGWEAVEAGEPTRAWQISATESVLGQSCVKLVGLQASPEWDRPRADRGAWRRVDTLWINARSGVTVRVERTVEQREPASRETSRLTTLRYDLESSLKHLVTLITDRRTEIVRAIEFRTQAAPMLPHPHKFGRELASLGRRIGSYLETQPATPFREAVLAVKRNVEAASRGEVVVAGYQEVVAPEPVATIGSLAPEFLATDMTAPGSARLARYKGKPVLMVFYHPGSESAEDVVRWAQSINAGLGKFAHVVGFSASDDATVVLKQRAALGATFPVLHGSGLRRSYGVTATPCFVVLDTAGVVRGTWLGWGRETGTVVTEELRRWLADR